MTRLMSVAGGALALLLVAAGVASPQGVQTGVLSGVVRSTDGLPLPGATVTLTSPALQGERTTVTEPGGGYIVRGLPPGTYTVEIQFPEMRGVTASVVVPLGGTATADATLVLATIAESVTVTASAPSPLTRPDVTANLGGREVDLLPTGRTPSLLAELAPGLTVNTPNANQVTIGGAFAYDNVFLLDGVDIGDNLLGRPDELFIEDAVEETQVLTGGISAEYGRFSGGVVNLVTKQGGDRFSGSFRINFSNQAWSDETPYEKSKGVERPSRMDRNYEGTFGGPLRRERLWFFTAARTQSSSNTTALPQTGLPFESTTDQQRVELKLTARPAVNQTLQAQYTDRRQTTVQPSIPASVDPRTRDETSQPGSLFVGGWNGVLANRFFATAQYSRKTNHPQYGGTSTAITDSPFLTLGMTMPSNQEYNAPYFDRNDPENRDNDQITASLAYFTSRPGFGTHDLKAGGERFTSHQRGGNSQSATGYVFAADYLTSGGAPVYDADGRLVPVFVPGANAALNTLPTRGAEIDIRTTSLYVQDRWSPVPALTVDAGLRYERVSSDATGVTGGLDAAGWAPRLGATYDLDGSGRTVLSGTYARYLGRYSSYVFGKNTPVSNPARLVYAYVGPAGQGLDFAPGFDLSNYVVVSGSFPTANIFMDENIRSPRQDEVTLGLGRELGDAGSVRATWIWRTTSDMVESFVDDPTAAGRTTVTYQGRVFGVFDNVVYRNSDVPERTYQAMQFQGSYRLSPRWSVAGHWTLQLKNDGNFEGEAANQPGVGSAIGDYPEIFSAARAYPYGRLDDFQRHKVRLWTIYNVDLGRFGSLDVAPLFRFDSGLTYSLVANAVALTAEQRALNPGYARLPTSQALYFGERGSGSFDGAALVDLGATYAVPVWKQAAPWVKLEVLNLFDNDALIMWDTTVTADTSSARDAYGLPTGYIEGRNFGQATSASQYARPRPGMTGGRTFLLSAGIRF
ncbi:MAG: TonB-dependent receptor [Vicinamibacterales bacterium]